ncbi:hypothetical protein SLE2022_056810 [Rubroshorea leprosula]
MSCFGLSIPVALILMISKIGKIVLKDYIDDYGLLENSLKYAIGYFAEDFCDFGCSFWKRKNICYMVACLLDDCLRLMVARSCFRAIWSVSAGRGMGAGQQDLYLSMSPYTYSGGLSFPPFFVISRSGLLGCYCSTVVYLPLLHLVLPLFH